MIADSGLAAFRNHVSIGAGNGFENIAVHAHVEGEHLAVRALVAVARVGTLFDRNRGAGRQHQRRAENSRQSRRGATA